ncbi:hypothetical protein JJB09_18525 [Rhizobium sp. KVB221]|uniref:NusG-like N-terminal domain-containing protein n=1 Tax=Rhizobium setariae TaxID=2801340 RepID=A0A936YP05_9HYPH|nr:transcription termination/antitermination NusG family protein [Rhizobium setariae]MBL0374020.1 hypothetical protein [Rhizobium setariae]
MMKTANTRSPAERNGRGFELVADLTWYALVVPPQKEFAAQEILKRRGVVTFCPFESLWRKKSRYTKEKVLRHFPVMPRYVFAGFAGDPSWFHVFQTPLILSVVGVQGEPAPIEGMGRLVSLFRNGLRRPDAERHMRTHREYGVGDAAVVVDGPLADRIVRVEEISGGHAFFRMELFGSEHRLSLTLDKLEAA